MKKLIYISLFAFFASCSTDKVPNYDISGSEEILVNLTDCEYASIAFDLPKELTEDAAKDIIVNFMESEQEASPLTRANSLPSISLIEKTVLQVKAQAATRNSTAECSNIQSLIYEFRIKDGINEGLALVSGDERSPALIAYISKYDEEAYAECAGAQIMLELAKASHLSDIVFIESLKDTLRDKTYAKIGRELNIPVENLTYDIIKDKIQIEGEVTTRVSPVTTPPTRIYSFVYPLITTKWNQTDPYNCKHPDIIYDKNTGRKAKPYAGCVEVAIAQIFAYCEVPTFRAQGPAVDWRLLKANPKIHPTDPLYTRNMVGNLMLEIFQQAGGYYAWSDAGIHSGTPTPESKFRPYIQRIISTGSKQAYNWTAVQNSLTALEPVVIWGANHCWILDGYAVCKKSVSAGTSQYDTYVTANLGWGGSNDGYYKLNDTFHTEFGSYKSSEQVILPNCKRK